MKKFILLAFQLLMPIIVFSQTLSSVSPASGGAGQTLDVTITGSGTHFSQASSTEVFFGFNKWESTIKSITVINDTIIKVNVTIPAYSLTNDYFIIVKNSIDGQLVLSSDFRVNGGVLPSLLSISKSQQVKDKH